MPDVAVQDGVFAGLIVFTRIPANWGMPGAAACLLLTALYALIRPSQTGQAVVRSWVQFAFPVFALLSVTWAVYPVVSLRAAVQMTLTAFAGLLLAQAPRPRAVLTGLFVAHAVYTVASLLAGQTRPDGIAGFPALYGLGGEAKNYFADTSGTATLLAMGMFAVSLERRRLIWSALTAITAILCALATVRAHSAGAVASLALAAALMAAMLVLRGRSVTAKLIFAACLMCALLLCGLLFEPLMAIVQNLSAKDAGLTGRGYLWYRADFIIAQRPWLGMGYFSFWTPANPDAIGLWRYFDIRQEGTAFSFHNSYIQTLVETGRIGLGVMLACWLIGLVALLRRFVMTPSLATCFWVGYLALQLSKTPVEPIRPAALVAPTIMIFAALGFGNFPVYLRRQAREHS
ncbi:hypothetical protein ASE49_11955 [Novosphingobium sp. Leaf2]|nr:hypothetical protein ASE49_11955 [Novosphingobium sp. Leaf2]